jgi:putative Mg2+ transporter-C (MgtC) family protein
MNGELQNPWQAIAQDFADLQDWGRLTHVALRLLCAALIGGLLGYQREQAGKSAGLRTYMLVTLGSAFFVIVPQLEGVTDMSRVIQGIITGIGFLGAGAILKRAQNNEIQGLTTAAGIWMAAAAGTAVGFGRLGTALIGALIGFLILGALYQLERRIKTLASDSRPTGNDSTRR